MGTQGARDDGREIDLVALGAVENATVAPVEIDDLIKLPICGDGLCERGRVEHEGIGAGAAHHAAL